MINVLILGAEGMLGSTCFKVFQQNPLISLSGTSRKEKKDFLYFNALFDALVAKIDFDKALSHLTMYLIALA